MPTVFAASTISVPAGTLRGLPSMVRLTLLVSGTGRDSTHVAFVPQRVVLVLVAEVAERGVDDPTGRVAEPAQAASVLQRIRNAAQVVELDLRTLVVENALVHADGPVAADATRRALAARFVCV